MRLLTASWALAISLLFSVLLPVAVKAASITFPVLGESTYTNDYNAPRANGCHCATDIIAKKGQPIVSATDGTIDYVAYPQPSWGFAVIVRSTAGNYYWYIHLNNDTPGTDDGKGGGMHAFAPDIKVGNPIKRGQLIGWVGDSGNSESTVPHLHFEIRDDSRNGPPINPYNLLKNNSVKISKPINYPALPQEILPYGASYNRTVNVARADVTGDGVEDIITGAEGEGSSPSVRVFDPQTGEILTRFYALDKDLRYGVDVAAGDVNGDGKNEIITGLRASKYAKVGVYSYDSTAKKIGKVKEFVAYTGLTSRNTPPRITTGDIDGDGKDEIITGTGQNSSAIVRAFSASGQAIKTYRPISSSFTGGIDVAAGDLANLSTTDEIIVSPLTKGSSRVMIFDASQSGTGLNLVRDFYAYGDSYRGGIRISVGELIGSHNGYEIASIPSSGARSVFRAISPTGKTLFSDIVLEEWWIGNYDVATGRDGSSQFSLGTGGNRRGSVR